MVRSLKRDVDYEVEEDKRVVVPLEAGSADLGQSVAQRLGGLVVSAQIREQLGARQNRPGVQPAQRSSRMRSSRIASKTTTSCSATRSTP